MRNKMRRISAAFFTAALLFALGAPRCMAAAVVDEVEARVGAACLIPPLVRARMETTVAALGRQLLAGRRIADAEASRAADEAVIHEVFDKVLVGYSVERVSLAPGETARIDVRLVPWADVIGAVELETRVEGMPPLVETLARRDLVGVARVFEEALAGLPVAASDWTNGVLKRSLGAYMEAHLPEFRADFDVEPGETAKVSLTVYPRLPVVRTVDLSMRSETIPNFALLNHRRRMQENVSLLIGVPVAFVERHQEELGRVFAESLDTLPDFRALALKTVVTMRPGRDMSVMSRSDTDKYVLRLEGWADVSHRHAEGRDTVFRFHAGRRFSPRDELFMQTDFAPQDVAWSWELGYARRLSTKTRLLARYDLGKSRFILGGEQSLGARWLLRYEYRWTDRTGEGALRYRVHDFLNVEYVVDSRDKWLRFIGNF